MRCNITGTGLGLRRDFIDDIVEDSNFSIDFLEIAPENWLSMGGSMGEKLSHLSTKYPLVCHGLSLNLGGTHPLDKSYLYQLKSFFKKYNIRCYTEHLSYCADSGHLYDLLPIPFTEEAVHYVANRIKMVQDILEESIGIENVSFYAMPTDELTEIEFIKAVLSEADCGYLLDVNNTYVNAINHQQYAVESFIEQMPTDRIMYLHMAGHFDESDSIKIDTHGQDVKEEVWKALDFTYKVHGILPTLLERDFNIPPLGELMLEVETIRQTQDRYYVSHMEVG